MSAQINLRIWVHQKLSSSNILLGSERVKLHELLSNGYWDHGALTTLHAHFKDDNESLDRLFYMFYLRYFNELEGRWKCRNASACLVALSRELSPEFHY